MKLGRLFRSEGVWILAELLAEIGSVGHELDHNIGCNHRSVHGDELTQPIHWDGVEILPKGIEDISKIPVLTKALFNRGYSNSEVRKILGENFKRVFKENNK